MGTKGTGTKRNILAVVAGLLGVLVGAALIWGSVGVLNEDRDFDGFSMSEPYRFDVSSRAIVYEGLGLFSDVPAGLAGSIADPGELRIRGSSATGRSLFMGIAATEDVERYFTLSHDELTGVELDGAAIANAELETRLASQVPVTRGVPEMWVAWTAGEQPQTLNWAIESGDWTVVVMNNDGSFGVEADLAFGAKYSNSVMLAWLAIAIGAALAIGGGYAMYRGLRPQADREQDIDPSQEAPADRATEPEKAPAHAG